jgi:hypothetical protein
MPGKKGGNYATVQLPAVVDAITTALQYTVSALVYNTLAGRKKQRRVSP